MSRDIKFQFVFKHPDSKQVIKSAYFTLDDLINSDEIITIEEIRERTLVCDCRPVGETNVVECNCDDYYDKFELIAKRISTGLNDKNGEEIFEGDIIVGQKGYVRADGYKSKKYPDIISVRCLVEYNNASFSWPTELYPIPEHKEAASNHDYRNVYYKLCPLGKGSKIYNNLTGKYDIEGDGMTCYNIEIVGNIYEHPDLLTLNPVAQ